MSLTAATCSSVEPDCVAARAGGAASVLASVVGADEEGVRAGAVVADAGGTAADGAGNAVAGEGVTIGSGAGVRAGAG